MASILDTGLAGELLEGILIFLLVYAVIYGTLSWRKVFGSGGTGTQALTAFVIALIAAIAPPARDFVTFVTPWYISLFMVIFFILFVVSMFGLSGTSDFPSIIKDKRVYTWILIFAVLIFIFGLGQTFGPALVPGGSQPAPQQTQQYPGMEVIGQDYAEPGRLAPSPYLGSGQQPVAPGQPGSTATSDFGTNLANTLFHPKVLGLLVTFVIAAVTVFFLSSPVSRL